MSCCEQEGCSESMEHLISTDKSKLNVETIHDYLCNKSYWAKGRSLEAVNKSIDNSLCFGLYDFEGNTLGFARVVTDTVVYAYLMDLFIVDEFQGKGLGSKLLEYILEQEELQVKLWFLATKSAHGLYQKFGFSTVDDPEKLMFKRDERCC